MIGWLAALALAGPVREDAHRSAAWRTLETRFFDVHFTGDGERTAREVARVADDLLLEIGGHVGWDPVGTVHVVVTTDRDDMDAFTFPRWGWIVLSADPGQYLVRLRGRQDWVTDALAHELGHLVGHRAAGAVPPVASYGWQLGGLGEAGPVAASAALNVGPSEPYGWSEGAAELWAEVAGVNLWSTSRDATLRTAALEGRLLEWDEWLVATDKGDVGDAERAYQQGYAFARWLRDEHGHDVFAAMTGPASARYPAGWGRLLEAVTGEPGRLLWARFRAQVTAEAAARAAAIRADGEVAGAEIELWEGPWEARDAATLERWQARSARDREEAREATGSWDLYPRFSPDGRWYAEGRVGWVKVSRLEEGRLPGLLGRAPDDLRVERSEWIEAKFGSAFSFVPGRDALVVAAPVRGRRDLHELAVIDLDAPKRPQRIPGSERARDPAVAPDGERVAWVEVVDGDHELVVARLDGSERRTLSAFGDGTALQHPSWSPDGRALVVSMLRTDRPDLWRVDVDSGAWTQLTADPQDELDPWWGPDGVTFASDPDGIFDIFRLDLETGRVERLTRVVGGAMTPSRTPAGHLLYTAVTAHGHKAYALHDSEWPLDDVTSWFDTTPDADEAARDLAWRPAPVALPSRRYSVARSLLPVALGPEIRLDLPEGRPVVLGGGTLRVRDALERVEIGAFGLAGEDLYGQARVAWRRLGPELALWAVGSSDRRVDDDLVTRSVVEAVGAEGEVEPLDDVTLTLGVEAAAFRQGPVDAVAPVLDTLRGRVQLEVGEPLDGAPGWRGSVRWTPGYTTPSGAEPYAWQRVELDLDTISPTLWSTGPLAEHRHDLELGLYGGFTSRDVLPPEELRAGGDAPYALRLGVLEPTTPFPGYAPFAIAGEAIAVGRIGWVAPIAPRIRSGTTLHARGVYARLGGDVGTAWAWGDRAVPLLADGVAEVRVRALLFDAPWDSVARIAWGLGEPAPRLYLGLGTGF